MDWSLSPQAFDDVDAILTFVEQSSCSSRVVAKLLDDFEKAFNDLAETPDVGRVRQELTGPSLRWWRVQRYLIVYDPHLKPLG